MRRIPPLAQSSCVPRAPARTAERISPLVSGVILGLGVYVLGPRWIMLEGWDRPNARSASAEAIDHRPAILADEA